MKYKKLIGLSLMLTTATWLAASISAQETIVVTDADIDGDVTWTANNVYQLDGKVFVEDGESLTIEAGTRIEGKFVEGGGVNASALVVARGGKIFANGTAENPIIFTSELDDGTLGPGDRGLWGGLIVLGRAVINSPVEEGQPINQDNVEGIDPITEPRGLFGGDNDDDDSGVIRYVSIRHGGAVIGADNEINGLTLGAVGRGTTIEFVEVFANLDDGIEFFGGTVNTKYMISAFCGDDGFDYDQGFRGNGQFWFVIQDGEGNYAGEHDGDIGTNDLLPITLPHIYNATYIGAGAGAPANENHTFLIRDNAGAKYYNSIFTDFTNTGVDVADDGVARLTAGDIELADNIWFGFGAGSTAAEIANANAQPIFEAANNNRIIDPMLGGISRMDDGGLDPRPAEGSPAIGAGRPEIANGFFCEVDFQGAFGEVNWAAPWSVLHTSGILTGEGAGEPDYPLAEDGGAPMLTFSRITDGEPGIMVSTDMGTIETAETVMGPWTDTGESSVTRAFSSADALYFRGSSTAGPAPDTFTVDLNGANARPDPIETAATGSGTLTLSGATLTLDVSYTGLESAFTNAHIHGPASLEETSGVLQPLDTAELHQPTDARSGQFSGSVEIDQATIDAILAGEAYINIHTVDNGPGEIRGQILPQN